jgi:phosphate starvation-inducible protein PhoH and related proteins
MITKRISLSDSKEALALFGQYDSNLKLLEKRYNVRIFARGGEMTIVGRKKNVENTENTMNNIISKLRNGNEEVEPVSMIQSCDTDALVVTDRGKIIKPRTDMQEKYVEAMNKYDMVFAIGPAGTGKTFLAVAQAIKLLKENRISRIILSRPIVEAGEKLGFLPGDFYEKVNPYLTPLFDAFYTILGPHHLTRYKSDGIVDIVPLAYMRGRTMEDAFIILDEAQNTSLEQMKMFLTRLGNGSKAVITGDVTQIDFENKKLSGLVLVSEVLSSISQIKFVNFSEADVLRHGIIKKVLKAFEKWEKKANRK